MEFDITQKIQIILDLDLLVMFFYLYFETPGGTKAGMREKEENYLANISIIETNKPNAKSIGEDFF